MEDMQVRGGKAMWRRLGTAVSSTWAKNTFERAVQNEKEFPLLILLGSLSEPSPGPAGHSRTYSVSIPWKSSLKPGAGTSHFP